MLKPEHLEDLKEIAKGIKSLDHAYGSGLMTPFANKVNSSRAAMTYQQVPQAKNLDDPHIARISTGWEKMYGDRSTSYHKTDREYEVVKKIQKFGNDMVYVLIIKDRHSNYYDIVVRNEVESFAESSGVRINNSVIDSKREGDKIKEGEVLYRSNSYDENMNYRLGVNAKTLYLTDPGIVEDSIRISESMAKMLTSTSVRTYVIPKNNNDVMLNTYGGHSSYKTFPDVGEKVQKRTLAVRRRVDYKDAQYLMKNKNLRKEMFGDSAYIASGTVVDIDIFCNTPADELPKDRAHEQINRYLSHITNFWKEIYDAIEAIKIDKRNTYSGDIGIYFARAKDFLSVGKHVKWNTETSIFDNMIISITVAKSSPVREGSKLVGRHGNKGVVGEIVPDHLMPRNEKGEYCDIVYDALSIIGRLNPSQLYEHEMNWLVDNILEGDGTKKQKFEAILDVLYVCNKDQHDQVKKFYDNLPKDEQKKFLDQIGPDFVIFQSASKSITFKQYSALIEKFQPKKQRFTIQSPDGTVATIQRKLIMSDTYVYRLKHEPETKFSIRSKGTINPRTFLPIKSHAYRKGTAQFNNQAVKLGSMEMDVLQLCNDPAAINYLTRLYCTSVVGRRQFMKLLNNDVFKEEVQIDMENSRSRVVDMFTATLLTCGQYLDVEFGDIDPIEEPMMESLESTKKEHIKIIFKENYRKNR